MKASDLSVLRTFAKMDIDKTKSKFSVTQFTLFSSLLTPDGAIHTPQEVYSLAPQ
jgi:2'-5' RNA ligase